MTNDGHVNVTNGTLNFSAQVTNNASGFISGEGTFAIRFEDGLDNGGSLILTFSTSTVFGNIVNNPTGLVSLAGNSTVSFIGDVSNNDQLTLAAEVTPFSVATPAAAEVFPEVAPWNS